MRKVIKKGLIYTLILIFLGLGILGLALPLVPQTIFFALALILISFEIPWVERKIENFLQKYPKVLKKYLELKTIIEKHLRWLD